MFLFGNLFLDTNIYIVMPERILSATASKSPNPKMTACLVQLNTMPNIFSYVQAL